MRVLEQFEMDGEVAFVTGGAAGIGEQLATAVAEAGADVVLADIDTEGAAETANSVEEATGASAMAVECNVADADAVEAAIQATVEEFGRLDASFANAGIAELEFPIQNYNMDQWERIIDVNLNVCSTPTVPPPR